MPKSIARRSLDFTGLYEAELLVELMLRFWRHPLAANGEFRSNLLESGAAVLRSSIQGERLFEKLHPKNVNFVAALWHAESVAVQEQGESSQAERQARQDWLAAVERTLPACFCDPDLLA